MLQLCACLCVMGGIVGDSKVELLILQGRSPTLRAGVHVSWA